MKFYEFFKLKKLIYFDWFKKKTVFTTGICWRANGSVVLCTSGRSLASCCLQEVLGGFAVGIVNEMGGEKYVYCCVNLFRVFFCLFGLLRCIFGARFCGDVHE